MANFKSVEHAAFLLFRELPNKARLGDDRNGFLTLSEIFRCARSAVCFRTQLAMLTQTYLSLGNKWPNSSEIPEHPC